MAYLSGELRKTTLRSDHDVSASKGVSVTKECGEKE
jgi:hypothetical protein